LSLCPLRSGRGHASNALVRWTSRPAARLRGHRCRNIRASDDPAQDRRNRCRSSRSGRRGGRRVGNARQSGRPDRSIARAWHHRSHDPQRPHVRRPYRRTEPPADRTHACRPRRDIRSRLPQPRVRPTRLDIPKKRAQSLHTKSKPRLPAAAPTATSPRLLPRRRLCDGARTFRTRRCSRHGTPSRLFPRPRRTATRHNRRAYRPHKDCMATDPSTDGQSRRTRKTIAAAETA
jgi:hypothetical protein